MTSPVTRRGAPCALASLPLVLAWRASCRLPVEREAPALDVRGREPVLLPITLENDEAVLAHAFQAAAKDALSVDRLQELDLRVPPREARVVPHSVECAINPRRADFEPVSTRHAICDVQRRRQIPRELGAEVERDPRGRIGRTGPLHRQVEEPATGARPPRELHRVHSMSTEDRLDGRDDSIPVETLEAFMAELHAE